MSTDVNIDSTSERAARAMDARARRAARRAGLVATRSRWRKFSIDNHGDFMLVDPSTRGCVFGERYDATAEEVLEFCSDD